MVTKKDKRHSGWITPRILKPQMKYSDMIKEALEPMNFYDDWEDTRDGMRDRIYFEWKLNDKKKIIIKYKKEDY